MVMQKFKTPSPEFLAEMMNQNLGAGNPHLDFSPVPRSVLAKVVHSAVMRGLSNESAPRVDISIGPDEYYHHKITGLAIITPTLANVFYEHEGSWYAACLILIGDDSELFTTRLVNDAEDEWEVLDPNDDGDFSIHRRVCVDALSYLGIMPEAALA